MSLSTCMPQWYGSPAVWHTPSLTRNGTPRNGPTGRAGSAAAAIALSSRRWITAFNSGLSLSMRVMAASTSSVGVTSPLRTNSACAVASIHAESSLMESPPVQRRHFAAWLVADDPATTDDNGACDAHFVEEPPVVGHEEHRAVVGFERLFELRDGGEIEVVP